jgi:hypothetical protein
MFKDILDRIMKIKVSILKICNLHKITHNQLSEYLIVKVPNHMLKLVQLIESLIMIGWKEKKPNKATILLMSQVLTRFISKFLIMIKWCLSISRKNLNKWNLIKLRS